MRLFTFTITVFLSWLIMVLDFKKLTEIHEKNHMRKAREFGKRAFCYTVDNSIKGIVCISEGEYIGSYEAGEKAMNSCGLSLGNVRGVCYSDIQDDFDKEMSVVKAGPLAAISRELESTLLLGLLLLVPTLITVILTGDYLLYVSLLLGLIPVPAAYILGAMLFKPGRLARSYDELLKVKEKTAFEIKAHDGEKIIRKRLFKKCFDLYNEKKLHPIGNIADLESVFLRYSKHR